jgi:hypothetical protein
MNASEAAQQFVCPQQLGTFPSEEPRASKRKGTGSFYETVHGTSKRPRVSMKIPAVDIHTDTTNKNVVILPMTRFALAKRMLHPISELEAGHGNMIQTILCRGSLPVEAGWGFAENDANSTRVYTMPMHASSSKLEARYNVRNGLSCSSVSTLLLSLQL